MTALVPATAGALLVAGLIGLTLGLRKTPPPAPAPGPTGAARFGRLAAVTPRTRCCSPAAPWPGCWSRP